ncbi:MAG: maleylacetoacetate isomerase [Novosphingobium sp.]
MELTFYDFAPSSAAYRVRIALELKKVAFRRVSVDLGQGEQRGADYLAINPQGLVPALAVDGQVIGQSLAIIDWLDAQFPQRRLIPAEPLARARVIALALEVAADVHPLNNLRVQKYLRGQLGLGKPEVAAWIARWMTAGFTALEQAAPENGFFGGDQPDLVDVFVVPQMANARRDGVSTDAFPRLERIFAAAMEMEAFAVTSSAALQSAQRRD